MYKGCYKNRRVQEQSKLDAEHKAMAIIETDAQESDLGWFWKSARHMSVWGSQTPDTETVKAAADSSSGHGPLQQMEDDAGPDLEQAAVLMRANTQRAADEELIEAEAQNVDLTNLSAEDIALLGISDGDLDAGMRRRVAVLFVAALRNSISKDLDGRNSIVAIAESGEQRISQAKREKLKAAAAALRKSQALALPPLDKSMRCQDTAARESNESEPNAPLSAPTRLDAPPDQFRRVLAFPSVGEYWKTPKKWHGSKTNAVPLFMTPDFPLRHSLAHEYGMHPAFMHSSSPMCMQTETLLENVETLAWEDLRVLEVVERARLEQVNSTLALDDPNNALGFKQHLDRLAYAAAGRYGDFLLVLKHGQANVGSCGKEYAKRLDEDMARHAFIPLETVLIVCSGSFVPAAREFAQAQRDRLAARSSRLFGRARAAQLNGFRKQLEAAGAPDSHTVMGCAKSEEIYQELVDVEMMRMFPGLFGPYSRRTAADGRWADISMQCAHSSDAAYTHAQIPSLLAFLDLLGKLGADYYFARSSRYKKKVQAWSNLEALSQRTAMSKTARDGWREAVTRLDSAVKNRRTNTKNGEVRALVVTNDRILQRDLPINKKNAACASMERLLFFGSGLASYQPFFARRIGKEDSAPGSPGYLNCLGRLFSQVPPLDLLPTELLAFAISWSPAHRDYLLPGYMDARHILLGEEPRSVSVRSGFQTDRQESPSQDCCTPPPPIACNQLDLELAQLRAREMEAEIAPRMLVPLADDDDSYTE